MSTCTLAPASCGSSGGLGGPRFISVPIHLQGRIGPERPFPDRFWAMGFAVVEIHDGVVLRDGRCSLLCHIVRHSRSCNACPGCRRRAPPVRPHDLKMKMPLLTGEWQGPGFAHEANRCIFYMVFHYFWGHFFFSKFHRSS